MEGLLNRAQGMDMRMILAGLAWELLFLESKVNCQLDLSILFDDFGVGRGRKMKQVLRYFTVVVLVGINLYIVEKKISDCVKMIDNLQVSDQESVSADPGMYQGHQRMGGPGGKFDKKGIFRGVGKVRNTHIKILQNISRAGEKRIGDI